MALQDLYGTTQGQGLAERVAAGTDMEYDKSAMKLFAPLRCLVAIHNLCMVGRCWLRSSIVGAMLQLVYSWRMRTSRAEIRARASARGA